MNIVNNYAERIAQANKRKEQWEMAKTIVVESLAVAGFIATLWLASIIL
jgi:hypothetical protein